MAAEPHVGTALPAPGESTGSGSDRSPSGDGTTDVSLGERARQALKNRWKVAVALFAILSALGTFYVATIPDAYTSTGVISFQPRLNESNGRDLTALLAARYPAVIASTSSVGRAASAAGVSASDVSSGLVASVEPSTLNMVFSVTLGSAQQAQNAAQSLYLSTLEYNTTDPFLEALRVETPTAAAKVVGLPKAALVAAVVVLSALVAAMSALVLDQVLARD